MEQFQEEEEEETLVCPSRGGRKNLPPIKLPDLDVHCPVLYRRRYINKNIIERACEWRGWNPHWLTGVGEKVPAIWREFIGTKGCCCRTVDQELKRWAMRNFERGDFISNRTNIKKLRPRFKQVVPTSVWREPLRSTIDFSRNRILQKGRIRSVKTTTSQLPRNNWKNAFRKNSSKWR